jgi:hypothetical protein
MFDQCRSLEGLGQEADPGPVVMAATRNDVEHVHVNEGGQAVIGNVSSQP